MADSWVAKPQKLVTRPIELFGRKVLVGLRSLGGFGLFMKDVLYWAVRRPFRFRILFQQLEFIGNQSLNIMLISALAVGAVFGLQIGVIFQIFRAETLMGAATGKALCQELAPLVSAILLTGRAGSSMTAEIATMKVNEQVDAMEAMAVDPISYLVVPRVLASMIMLPFLCGVFIFIGVLGSYIAGVILFNVDQGLFLEKISRFVLVRDIVRGLIKAFVFAIIMGAISCRFGLMASGGAKGVGRATTNAVVATLLTVLAVDVVITYFQIVW